MYTDTRLLKEGLRSSTYITKFGDIYKIYKDTGSWENVVPKCRSDGKVCYNNKRLERAIAEAWLEKPDVTTENGRYPNVSVIDDQKSPYDADNLKWCIGKKCKRYVEKPLLSPRLLFVYEMLIDDEYENMDDVCDILDVSKETAYGYICNVLSTDPCYEAALNCRKLVCEQCLNYCIEHDVSGSLTYAMSRIDEFLKEDSTWLQHENRFSQLRLSRIISTIIGDS